MIEKPRKSASGRYFNPTGTDVSRRSRRTGKKPLARGERGGSLASKRGTAPPPLNHGDKHHGWTRRQHHPQDFLFLQHACERGFDASAGAALHRHPGLGGGDVACSGPLGQHPCFDHNSGHFREKRFGHPGRSQRSVSGPGLTPRGVRLRPRNSNPGRERCGQFAHRFSGGSDRLDARGLPDGDSGSHPRYHSVRNQRGSRGARPIKEPARKPGRRCLQGPSKASLCWPLGASHEQH